MIGKEDHRFLATGTSAQDGPKHKPRTGSDCANGDASGKISSSGLISGLPLVASPPAAASTAKLRLGVCAVVLPGPWRSSSGAAWRAWWKMEA